LADQQAITGVSRVQKPIKEAKIVEKIYVDRCLYIPPSWRNLVWWPDNRFAAKLTDVSLRKRDHERPHKEYQENLERKATCRLHGKPPKTRTETSGKSLTKSRNLGVDPLAIQHDLLLLYDHYVTFYEEIIWPFFLRFHHIL
jgi:hypothetical protein